MAFRIFETNIDNSNIVSIEENNSDFSGFTSKLIRLCNDTNCNVDVILVPQELLSKWYFYVALADSDLRNYKKDKPFNPNPIIFISVKNIFQNYKKFDKRDIKKDYKKRNIDYQCRMKNFTLDKRKYFMDSSIWHYYLPLEEWNKRSFYVNLIHILKAIKRNCDLKLYDTVIAKEFVEFQTRLMRTSYLENAGGGHAQHITPFVFHSETEMRIKADNKLNKLKEKYKNANINWNVLLVDDYSEINLKPFNNGEKVNSKYKIIKNLLKDDISVKNANNADESDKQNATFNFIITPVPENDILRDVKEKIEKSQYDIILLDYLLGRKKNSNERELGSELFTPSYEDLNKYKGPLDRFWIFPITVFSKAMREKTRSLGISHINDNWYLFDGADPVLTPQLFRYKLFQLMDLQLGQTIVTIEDIVKFIMYNKTGNDNSKATNNENTDDKSKATKEKDVYPTREDARRLYGVFMHKFGLRGALKYDAKKGSVFAKSVLKYMYDERFEDLRFYESVRKLLYLVGFSTHHDAVLMWDILTYINSVTNSIKFEDKKTDKEKSGKEKVIDFLKDVREYISKLKQSR